MTPAQIPTAIAQYMYSLVNGSMTAPKPLKIRIEVMATGPTESCLEVPNVHR